MNDVVKSGTEVAQYDETQLGAVNDVTAADITPGRISVMQKTSVLVDEEKAKAGEIVNLDTEEVLGDSETACEVVILKSHKYWIEKEGDDFKARFPATDPNELPWTEGNISRMYHHAFFVLLPSEIKDGVEMPYEIAFRSTDLGSAKKISKMLLAMGRKKVPSWGRKFEIKTVKKTKDKNTWFVTDVQLGEETDADTKQVAFDWYEQLSKATINHAAPEASGQVKASEEY